MNPRVETAVLAANQAFYDAFTGRDVVAMSHLWAKGRVVACVHPGRKALLGRDAVMASWRAILDSAESPKLEVGEAAAVVVGDAAFVVCIEHIGDARLAATNVFALEEGEWRMVHHHASPMSSTESRRPSTALN